MHENLCGTSPDKDAPETRGSHLSFAHDLNLLSYIPLFRHLEIVGDQNAVCTAAKVDDDHPIAAARYQLNSRVLFKNLNPTAVNERNYKLSL